MGIERIEAIMQGLAIPGKKVVDLSFIGSGIFNHKDCSHTLDEKILILQGEIQFVEALQGRLMYSPPHNVLVPEESSEESHLKQEILKSRSNGYKKSLKKKNKGGHGIHGSGNMKIMGQNRELMMQVENLCSRLYSRRRNQIRNFFNSPVIPQIDPRLLPFHIPFLRAFKPLHEEYDRKRKKVYLNQKMGSLVINDGHDASISAKAFALSYSSPVHLLTGDTAFPDVFEAFYNRFEQLSNRYQFAHLGNPPNKVKVVIRLDDELKMLGHPKAETKYVPYLPPQESTQVTQANL